MTLEGRRILITGGARRIGRALALAFAREGASVAITYHASQREAEQLLREMPGHAPAFALAMDVRDPVSVREGVASAAEDLGGLDTLVNNAGRFEAVPLEQITVEQWDAMQQTNARGPLLVSQAAHPLLKQARGRIVNLGSLGGTHAWASHAHYCTSKAALHMLSQSMAKAWAPEIAVNCIAPGMIYENGATGPNYERFAAKTPMQRNGTVDDVVAAAMFFVTAPHFITGQVLAVDGGLGL
jgi:NAD(P)-dependent dehydrogenase (short-subunit alcohol dehydrogenase family)